MADSIMLHLPNQSFCFYCGVSMPDGWDFVWINRCPIRERVASVDIRKVVGNLDDGE